MNSVAGPFDAKGSLSGGSGSVNADGGTLGIDPERKRRIFLNRLKMFSGLNGDELLEAVARHDAAMPHNSLADERLCVICEYRRSDAYWNAG